MRICGIVAEYQPFHKGHAYHISKTRAAGASHIVAVMSGNFTQRGQAACFDKYTRTAAALRCGADLVIELPVCHALSGAERFGDSALRLLRMLGCVEMISFGCEGELSLLRRAADVLLSPEFSGALCQGEKTSFAAARQEAVRALAGDEVAETLSHPNNILGVEYLKALRRLEWEPEVVALPRAGAGHDSPLPAEGFASASLLRTLLGREDGLSQIAPYVPAEAMEEYRRAVSAGLGPISEEKAELLIFSALRRLTPETAALLPDCSEGLENRLVEVAHRSSTLEEFYREAPSRRISLARIRRASIHALLGITASLQQEDAPYLRVLGMNERGQEILSLAKETACLPIITKPSSARAAEESVSRFLATEAAADDLYRLMTPKPAPCGELFTRGIVVAREGTPPRFTGKER
ncbi:MAG: nucleotidyltransferase family protein [Ruminococcaceae bacterium]|nr:nucleotidyltransferase family protein [Oscillospiraceae bacterium]